MAELRIYDTIGLLGVSSAQFTADLVALDPAEPLDIRIDSPGGDMFAGITIHNAIRRHPGRTTVHIDSLAGSAASFVAVAGDDIVINRYARMMIHDAAGVVVGAAADMADMAGLLDSFSATIAQIYADRRGGTPEAWRAAMLAETWYDADQAAAAGLVDRIDTADQPTTGAPAAATAPTASAQILAVAAARRRRTHRKAS